MATSNEEIRDGLIRHQIGIIQVSGALRNAIIGQVDRAQVDLQRMLRERLDKIEQRGFDYGPVTTRRVQALERALDSLLAPSYRTIERLVNTEMVDLAQHEMTYLSTLIASNLPVQVTFALPTIDQLRSIVFSRPMQGRILKDWLADWEAADKSRIMDQIKIGLIQGESNAAIRRRVLGSAALGGTDGVRNTTKRGADFLTRTVTNAVANNARQLFYKRNIDIISKEVYSATLDSRTTIECASLDGDIFSVNKGPIPPIHGRCRSTRYPYIDGVNLGNRPASRATRRELEGLTAKQRAKVIRDKAGPVPASQTYEEFLRNQPLEFVEDVLGKTKAKLFLNGKLPIDRFVDKKLHVLTLDDLRKKESAAFKKAGL